MALKNGYDGTSKCGISVKLYESRFLNVVRHSATVYKVFVTNVSKYSTLFKSKTNCSLNCLKLLLLKVD